MYIISENVLFYFKIYFFIILIAVVSSLGTTANILNISVYWRLGFKDNVNITFMFLSVCDLSHCLLFNLFVALLIIDVYFPLPNINTLGLAYVSVAHTRGIPTILSTLVTVFLSLERCICIMFPFKVKELFTTRRLILFNLSFVVVALACVCPAFATQGLQWAFDPVTNRTRLVLWLSPNRPGVEIFVERFNGMVVPLLAQILITGSAGFMVKGIKKSVDFRKEAAMTPASISAQTTSRSTKRNKTMTHGSTKITQVVILLAIIYFVCNLPTLVVLLLRVLIPDTDAGRQQRSLYSILYAIVTLFSLINSSVNIFAYYYVSSRYKHQIRVLFRLNYSRI